MNTKKQKSKVTVNFGELDSRIEEKFNYLRHNKKLSSYLASIIIGHETELIKKGLLDSEVTKILIGDEEEILRLKTRVDSLEKKIEKLEKLEKELSNNVTIKDLEKRIQRLEKEGIVLSNQDYSKENKVDSLIEEVEEYKAWEELDDEASDLLDALNDF